MRTAGVWVHRGISVTGRSAKTHTGSDGRVEFFTAAGPLIHALILVLQQRFRPGVGDPNEALASKLFPETEI